MQTTNFWETMANTPWWMFVIIFYLCKLAIVATKPRKILVRQIMMMPIIFMSFSLLGFCFYFPTDISSVMSWIGMFVIGLGFGWLQFKRQSIAFAEDGKALQLPGTYTALVMVILILGIKYSTGLWNADTPQLLHGKALGLMIMGYGFFSGIFAGRALVIRKALRAL